MNESPKELEVKHTSPQTGKITNFQFMFGPSAAKHFCKIKVGLLFGCRSSVFVFDNMLALKY